MSGNTPESIQPNSFREMLGYLNFSDGTPSTSFQAAVNGLFTDPDAPANSNVLKQQLLSALAELLTTDEPGFNDTTQAANVVSTAIDRVIPAYRQHHVNLLFHLDDVDFFSPFFLGRVFEATLHGGNQYGWDNDTELISAALICVTHNL